MNNKKRNNNNELSARMSELGLIIGIKVCLTRKKALLRYLLPKPLRIDKFSLNISWFESNVSVAYIPEQTIGNVRDAGKFISELLL